MREPPAPAADPLLRVRGLSHEYPVRRRGLVPRVTGHVRALDDVSFDLMPGESLGLVGESGCGKTTLARCLLRALRPASGTVELDVDGRPVDLLALSERELRPLRTRVQMIFQDPFASLNPHMTAGEIVGEPLVVHRLAHGRELEARVAEMLERVGLDPAHAGRYPHAFSGGQRQRLGIARALILEPALVVADEPVSALDVSVQAQVINLLRDLQRELRLTTLFIAHDLSVVRHVCDRVAVMHAGRIVELAPVDDLFSHPQHEYTRLLLSAIPSPDPDQRLDFSLFGG